MLNSGTHKFNRHFLEFLNILGKEYTKVLNEATIIPFEKYNQIIFLVGGAGSGKNFALDNMIGSNGKNVDVDNFKTFIDDNKEFAKERLSVQLEKLEQNNTNGQFNDKIAKIEKYIEFLSKDIDFGNAEDMFNLHAVSKLLFEKDDKNKQLLALLASAKNSRNKPNIVANITGKRYSDISDVAELAITSGYEPKNIHIVWVLTPHNEAQINNKKRNRKLDKNLVKATHEGINNTMADIEQNYDKYGLRDLVDGKIVILFNSKGVDNSVEVSKWDDNVEFSRKRGKDYVKRVKWIDRIVIKEVGEDFKSDNEIEADIKKTLNQTNNKNRPENRIKSLEDYKNKRMNYPDTTGY